jgi:hypothetical protein
VHDLSPVLRWRKALRAASNRRASTSRTHQCPGDVERAARPRDARLRSPRSSGTLAPLAAGRSTRQDGGRR